MAFCSQYSDTNNTELKAETKSEGQTVDYEAWNKGFKKLMKLSQKNLKIMKRIKRQNSRMLKEADLFEKLMVVKTKKHKLNEELLTDLKDRKTEELLTDMDGRKTAEMEATLTDREDTRTGRETFVSKNQNRTKRNEKTFLEKLGDAVVKTIPNLLKIVVTVAVNALFRWGMSWNRNVRRSMA